VGTVVYLDSNGNPLSSAASTSEIGQFVICGVNDPSAPLSPFQGAVQRLVQVRVTSEEDSGALLVPVYSDGVTVASMGVNKAPPRKVAVSGQVQSLKGPESGPMAMPVGNARIAVLGSLERATADGGGAYSFSLHSNSRFILRAEKEGYLPSYNYQVETPVITLSAELPPLWTLSTGEAAELAAAAGISLAPGLGVVAGQVVTPGLSPQQVSSVSLDPPLSLFSGFSNNDRFPDLYAVYGDGAVRTYLSDGAGGFSALPSLQLRGGTTPISSVQAVEPDDFDRDGATDLALIGDGRLFIIFGNRLSGSFEEGIEIEVKDEAGALKTPQAFTVSDIDSDGFPDLVVAAVADGNPFLF
ncbi:MAG TPA: VCBS repeat-containing protein, partial [Candidatus Manganitrophaceae bacterium]